jgi:hypothetical protein
VSPPTLIPSARPPPSGTLQPSSRTAEVRHAPGTSSGACGTGDVGLGAVGPGNGGGGNHLDPLARGSDHVVGHGSGVIGDSHSGGVFSARDRGGDAGPDKDRRRRQLRYGRRRHHGRRLQRRWSGRRPGGPRWGHHRQRCRRPRRGQSGPDLWRRGKPRRLGRRSPLGCEGQCSSPGRARWRAIERGHR